MAAHNQTVQDSVPGSDELSGQPNRDSLGTPGGHVLYAPLPALGAGIREELMQAMHSRMNEMRTEVAHTRATHAVSTAAMKDSIQEIASATMKSMQAMNSELSSQLGTVIAALGQAEANSQALRQEVADMRSQLDTSGDGQMTSGTSRPTGAGACGQQRTDASCCSSASATDYKLRDAVRSGKAGMRTPHNRMSRTAGGVDMETLRTGSAKFIHHTLADADKTTVLIMPVLVRQSESAGIPAQTAMLTHSQCHSWTMPRRAHDTLTVWDAFVGFPTVTCEHDAALSLNERHEQMIDVMDEVSRQLAARLAAYTAEVRCVDLYKFNNVLVMNNLHVTGVVRLDVVVPLDKQLAEVGEAVEYMGSIPGVTTYRPLDFVTDLHTIYRACSNAPHGPFPLTAAHRHFNIILSALATESPYVDVAHVTEGAAYSDGTSRSDHSYGGRRTPWAKSAVADIASTFPECKSSVRAFVYGALNSLHSVDSSNLPDLLKEAEPYRTAMSALMRKLTSSNSLLSTQLNDTGTKDSLNQAHNATLREYGHFLEAARLDGTPRNLDLFYDLLAAGALNIRACISRTSALGELQSDAAWLLNYISTVPSDSEMDYVCYVDAAFSTSMQLEGEAMTHRMCVNGMLTSLLPTFVGRLSSRLKDRALEFFNDVARSFKQDGPFRNALPAHVRTRVDTHLSLHREVNQLAPRLDRMEAFEGPASRHGQMARALQILEQQSHGLAVRMLHVPADLHWVASSGLLPYYWRNLIRNLLGGFTRTIRPPPSTLFMSDATPGADDAPADHDEDNDDAGVFATQTRQSRDRDAAAGAGGGAPRRPRFDPNAMERWGARADKVTDTMKTELERVEARLAKHTEALRESFEASLAKNQAATIAREEQLRENNSHLHRTLEKILSNISIHAAPELQKAPALTDAVNAARSAARVAETHLAAVDPHTQLEIYAMQRDRTPMKLDSEGFKLGHVNPNRWNDINDDMKGVYAARDGVSDEAGFKGLGKRCCTNCPIDAPNMPHRQESCPFDWRGGKAGEAKLAPAIVSRGRQRIRDNVQRLKAGQPAILVVECDSDGE